MSCTARATPTLLFTENETNSAATLRQPDRSPYVKDGINDYVVDGRQDAVNPDATGTKAAAHYRLDRGAGRHRVVRLRLRRAAAATAEHVRRRLRRDVRRAPRRGRRVLRTHHAAERQPEDARSVMRQALAGMLWSKQFYFFDVRHAGSTSTARIRSSRQRGVRNADWFHMVNADIISMPDKWEYPWYAAWDLAFHTIALAMVDPDFAKEQLDLMLRELLPASERPDPGLRVELRRRQPAGARLGDACSLYRIEQALQPAQGDLRFPRSVVFSKLLLNFTWWVNRKDPLGSNVFEGGFLGLDNIGVFDRSAPLPTGGYLEQADGTAWMALFCQNMLEIALELAVHDPIYEDCAAKFAEHFLWIAAAMDRIGDSMTGCGTRRMASSTTCCACRTAAPRGSRCARWSGCCRSAPRRSSSPAVLAALPAVHWSGSRLFCERNPELTADIAPDRHGTRRQRTRHLLAAARREQAAPRAGAHARRERVPRARTASARCRASTTSSPYVFHVGGQEYRVDYLPAESDTGMFGGNSNWRGPVWMPVNVADHPRRCCSFYGYYGDDFKVECPTGSGQMMTLFEVAQEISRPADPASSCATQHGRRPGLRRHREVPERSALARPDPVLRILPRRQRRRPRRQPPDRLDGPRRPLIQLFGSLEAARVLETGPGLIDTVE